MYFKLKHVTPIALFLQNLTKLQLQSLFTHSREYTTFNE